LYRVHRIDVSVCVFVAALPDDSHDEHEYALWTNCV